MATFNTRRIWRPKKLEKIWIQTAHDLECRDPEVLWDLWARFNTVTISLLDENAFFADALEIAKFAKDRRELENLISKRVEERKEEIKVALDEIGLAILYHRHNLDSKDAQSAASKVVRTISLDSFVQFVGGFTFGWGGGPMVQRHQIYEVPEDFFRSTPDEEEPTVDDDFRQWDSDFSSMPNSPILPPTAPIPRKDSAAAAATAAAPTLGEGARTTPDAEQPTVPPNTTDHSRTAALLAVEPTVQPNTTDDGLVGERAAANVSRSPVSQPPSSPSPTRPLWTGKVSDAPTTPPQRDAPSTVTSDSRPQRSASHGSDVPVKRVNGGNRTLGGEPAAGRTSARKRRRDDASYSDGTSDDEQRKQKRRVADVYTTAREAGLLASGRVTGDDGRIAAISGLKTALT